MSTVNSGYCKLYCNLNFGNLVGSLIICRQKGNFRSVYTKIFRPFIFCLDWPQHVGKQSYGVVSETFEDWGSFYCFGSKNDAKIQNLINICHFLANFFE